MSATAVDVAGSYPGKSIGYKFACDPLPQIYFEATEALRGAGLLGKIGVLIVPNERSGGPREKLNKEYVT